MGAMKGYLELVRPFQLRGWVINLDAVEEPVEVEARLENAEVASARADMFRNDLVGIHGGSGAHGFVLNLPVELSQNQQDEIEVTARSRDLTLTLTRVRAAAECDLPSPPRQIVPIGAPWDGVDRAHHPVFVLGAARSGTSAMAQGLLRATRYQGHGEGHLLDILPELLGVVERHYRNRGEEWSLRPTMIAEVPKSFLVDGCRHLMVEIARKLFPAGDWLDKTPRGEMILAAPALRQIWPNARFVFMRRRGIDNISSRLRKFPTISFRDHCEDWARSMQDWSSVRALLKGSAIEIDQLAVARFPGRVADAVGNLLDLRGRETDRFRTALMNDRPEQTSSSVEEVGSLDDTGWSRARRTEFRSVCSDMMEAYEYTYDHTYYRGGDEAGLRIV